MSNNNVYARQTFCALKPNGSFSPLISLYKVDSGRTLLVASTYVGTKSTKPETSHDVSSRVRSTDNILHRVPRLNLDGDFTAIAHFLRSAENIHTRTEAERRIAAAGRP